MRRLLIWLTLAIAACSGAPPAPVVQHASPSNQPVATPDAVTVRFAVKGDWGAGTPEQREVTDAMCRLRRSRPFQIVVTTGDNFYRPDGQATPANYREPEACLLKHPGHTWVPAWGNHDVSGRDTAVVLGAPSRFYTRTIGDLQLFVLDSNDVSSRDQLRWFTEEAASSRAKWKVAVFHHPPFTLGGHTPNQAVRRMWLDAFAQTGIDLVLNGHNHGYEHHQVGGIHYIVTGGGGAQLYPCIRDDPAAVTCLAQHHFLIVEATVSRISVEAISPDGETIDEVMID